jgi:uncharacterized protein YdhG (YjbR/CyaY superfamily)
MKYEKAASVKSYLEAIPAERKPQLRKIIALIKKVAPGITEEYSHNMPFYPYNGKPMFAVASQKLYMAIYITEKDLVADYKNSLGKANIEGSCIRFKNIESLDLGALERLLTEVYERRLSS